MRFSKNGGGNPTLNMLTIFVNWSRSSCFIYNKDVYVLKTEECATLNFGVRFKSVMQHCVQFSKNNCEVTTMNMLIIFVNWYISSCYIYWRCLFFENRGVCYFEIWCKVRVCRAPLCSIFEKKLQILLLFPRELAWLVYNILRVLRSCC